MARLVDYNVRSNAINNYGRNPNNAPPMRRPEPRVQVVKAYGTLNSTGVCPDGSTCTTPVTSSEVEFTLNIYKRGCDYFGEVYIVNYDTRSKVNSNHLIYYQDHDGAYVLCIFLVITNNNCVYELIVNFTPTSCVTKGSLFCYVAPIYTTGLNIGGTLTSGEICLCEACQHSNHDGPLFNAPSNVEPHDEGGPGEGSSYGRDADD